ncbi:MAG: hypothetical protein ACKVW3_02585 [Phycisphaerales bacterium]
MLNRALVTLLASVSLASPTLAQSKSKQEPTKRSAPAAQPSAKPQNPAKVSPAAVPVALELSDDLFRIESIGLALRLPVGVISQRTSSGSTESVQLSPGGADPAWVITIQSPQSKNTEASAEVVAKQVLDQFRASVGTLDRTGKLITATSAVILQPVEALKVESASPDQRRPAYRFYVSLPRGERESPVVHGYTVFQSAPGRFVVFDLLTTETALAKARPVYETIVASAQFEDPAKTAAERGTLLESGVSIITSLTPEDYDAAIAATKDVWYRRYRPGPAAEPSDTREIAYARVRAWKGSRGEIDTLRSHARWNEVDKQQGYLVRIDARELQDRQIIDSVGVYFMSFDRKEEAWTLQMAFRDGSKKNPPTWTESGARTAASLTVNLGGSGQESRTSLPRVPDIAYLNQVETFLLPQLLLRVAPKQAGASDFMFYSYQSASNSVRLRRDTLTTGTEPGIAWTLATRLDQDKPPFVVSYDENLQTVRIALADGTFREPVTLQKLADMWRTQGLPID